MGLWAARPVISTNSVKVGVALPTGFPLGRDKDCMLFKSREGGWFENVGGAA